MFFIFPFEIIETNLTLPNGVLTFITPSYRNSRVICKGYRDFMFMSRSNGVSVKQGPDARGFFLVSLLCLLAWLVIQLFARCLTIQLEKVAMTFSLGSINRAVQRSGLYREVKYSNTPPKSVFFVRNVVVIRCSIGTRQE